MDGRRAAPPPASLSGGWRADDSELGDEELGVFTAERYFNGALAAEDALWCDRSSSSFSSVFKTWQHEGSAQTPTAATSSSEASWNGRSALLPNRPVVAADPAVEAKPSSMTASEQTGRKPPLSSSHLRRWLLSVTGCACACGDGEELDLCHDELEASSVHGGNKRSTEADAMLPRSTSKHITAVEDVTTVSVMPGKWVDDDDDAFLATQPPPQLAAESGQRRGRAANSGELSMRMLNPTTTASYDERRRESLDMFRPAGQGSTLVPAKQHSAITIVAGSTARGGAASAVGGGGRGSPDSTPPRRACGSRRDSGPELDDAAPSELECAYYPPSEASVVWSVVTAEGAASGNFSSAASGCQYYFTDGDEQQAWRHRAASGATSNRPRSKWGRINGGGLLMGCISRRAVDAIGPPRT